MFSHLYMDGYEWKLSAWLLFNNKVMFMMCLFLQFYGENSLKWWHRAMHYVKRRFWNALKTFLYMGTGSCVPMPLVNSDFQLKVVNLAKIMNLESRSNAMSPSHNYLLDCWFRPYSVESFKIWTWKHKFQTFRFKECQNFTLE